MKVKQIERPKATMRERERDKFKEQTKQTNTVVHELMYYMFTCIHSLHFISVINKQ